MSETKKLAFLAIYLLVPLPFIGLWLGGFYTFLPFAVIFCGIPLLDYFFTDSVNPSKEQEAELAKDKYFRRVVLCFVPVQIFLILGGCYVITTHELTNVEWWGFALSVGIVSGGVGINLAHELMHKKNQFDQNLSKIVLSLVCYGHWGIEHVRGHHLNVATPKDPATAPYGMNLYRFLIKTISGTIRSSWKIEQRRLRNKGYHSLSWHNNFWWIVLSPMAIMSILYMVFGSSGVGFFLIQSASAILLLEIVNYIEHYGLERKLLANGHYEKVSPLHSWNSNHWFSNLILFHLQRHSDHHTYGARPYQLLRHMEESPQLPSGYLGMLLLAIIPPLWFAVMNKKVLAYRDKLELIDTTATKEETLPSM